MAVSSEYLVCVVARCHQMAEGHFAVEHWKMFVDYINSHSVGDATEVRFWEIFSGG